MLVIINEFAFLIRSKYSWSVLKISEIYFFWNIHCSRANLYRNHICALISMKEIILHSYHLALISPYHSHTLIYHCKRCYIDCSAMRMRLVNTLLFSLVYPQGYWSLLPTNIIDWSILHLFPHSIFFLLSLLSPRLPIRSRQVTSTVHRGSYPLHPNLSLSLFLSIPST